ncbi:sortase [Nocardioides dubius]|uniref:Sortase n=1 Tax=Nocardioides dubius TaxID=317019 RepID=A0ABN1U1C3_9ACTN
MTTAAPTGARVARPAPARADDEQLRLFSTSLTMLGLLAVWFLAQLFVLSAISQDRQQQILHDRFRAELASAVAPVGPIVDQGAPVALLRIPALELDQVVVEGTTSGDLLAGPGHRRDTALPGQVGTSLVYGRSGTYGAPFAKLAELSVGDRIEVVAGQGTTRFSVIGIRRAGDPLPQPASGEVARLTLATSEGEGRLGALARGDVVYVDAEAEKGFPAPAGRFSAVGEEEKAMGTDHGILPRLALLLGLLVLTTLAIVAARQRWSAALTWVVATPVAVALCWATTDAAMRLLPNLV